MEKKVELLDCTLRDGAYICESNFGTPAIKGIIKKMKDANIDIIECGWLKNEAHKLGTSYYHVPKDLEQYLPEKDDNVTFVAMIDWDRYDLDYLPIYDGKSIDAIRVVFPHDKYKEGIKVGKEIKKKGYQVFLQAANTLAYSNDELEELAKEINAVRPNSLSVVDTFGAMYEDDLERIVKVLDQYLDKGIKLGFHSHNNQQLSFALTMHFVNILRNSERNVIVDASLCGMGRGAGNATTELVANFLNMKYHCNFDMNVIMDAIDIYMEYFQENYSWGYSIPYFIAGMYCCHVNNIAYLLKNHRTNAKDMYNIVEALSPEQRMKYDYDLLESKYIENQNRIVNDEEGLDNLKKEFKGRQLLLIAPGKSAVVEQEKVKQYIEKHNPIIIGVNAINEIYDYDYLFLINSARYDYAKEVYPKQFANVKKILLSSIKTEAAQDEIIVNFYRVVKCGWEHFDNAVIDCLRLMDKLHVKDIALAGFDEFGHKYNESYADAALPTLNPDNKWDELNEEIIEIFKDFKMAAKHVKNIEFITQSMFK